MTIVHVNTELRLAWRKGIEEGLRKDPDELAPYKIMPADTGERAPHPVRFELTKVLIFGSLAPPRKWEDCGLPPARQWLVESHLSPFSPIFS